MSTCDHYDRRTVWHEYIDDWTGEKVGEWREDVKCLQKDVGIGAFKCTRCGEVGYYTGTWRNYYENGTPCFGSEGVPRNLKEPNA